MDGVTGKIWIKKHDTDLINKRRRRKRAGFSSWLALWRYYSARVSLVDHHHIIRVARNENEKSKYCATIARKRFSNDSFGGPRREWDGTIFSKLFFRHKKRYCRFPTTDEIKIVPRTIFDFLVNGSPGNTVAHERRDFTRSARTKHRTHDEGHR